MVTHTYRFRIPTEHSHLPVRTSLLCGIHGFLFQPDAYNTFFCKKALSAQSPLPGHSSFVYRIYR